MVTSTTTIRTTTTTSVWCEPESEAAPLVTFRSVFQAYQACRKRKGKTVQTCFFEQNGLDNLFAITHDLQAQVWRPAPPVVFYVAKPKAREIYAAQFQDRVVHHWLVPRLEALFDNELIYDCAANRKGKGTHFAVERLQRFMRKQGGKLSFLQLDVANFFNTIRHDILLDILAQKLSNAVKKHKVSLAQARYYYALARQIISQPVVECAIHKGDKQQGLRIPAHKQLANAPAGVGLAIGNLTSQFFANLYLNELDQFVKHRLRCRYYVRYVDDFILLHPCQQQLQQWHGQLADFVQARLSLALKKQHTLAVVTQGADFLGYIVRPSYRLVRRRVVGNLYEKLLSLAKVLWRPRAGGWHCDLNYPLREQLCATLASYWGHFNHANTQRLKRWFFQRFAWLTALYRCEIDLTPRWQPHNVTTFRQQVAYFKRHYMVPCLLLQKGNQVIELHSGAVYPINNLNQRLQLAQKQGQAYALVTEQGYLRSGLKRRVLRQLWLPAGTDDDYFSVQPQEEHAYA